MEYQESKEYYEGYQAHKDGKYRNPYACSNAATDIQKSDWNRGWRAAENDYRLRQLTLEQDIKATQPEKKSGAIESADDYLNEIVAVRAGCPVKRKDTLSMERIKMIREIFPVIFAAGQDSALRQFRKK